MSTEVERKKIKAPNIISKLLTNSIQVLVSRITGR
jgi:hypothetical protein